MTKDLIETEIKQLLKQFNDVDINNLPKLSTETLSTLYAIAYDLYEKGKTVDSKQIFRFLTLLDPFDRRYWMGLAASYQVLKDYQTALETYSIAAIQEPNDPYVHLYAADCLFALGQNKKAVQTLESAITVAEKANDASLISQLQYMHESWTGKKQPVLAGVSS